MQNNLQNISNLRPLRRPPISVSSLFFNALLYPRITSFHWPVVAALLQLLVGVVVVIAFVSLSPPSFTSVLCCHGERTIEVSRNRCGGSFLGPFLLGHHPVQSFPPIFRLPALPLPLFVTLGFTPALGTTAGVSRTGVCKVAIAVVPTSASALSAGHVHLPPPSFPKGLTSVLMPTVGTV